MKMTKILWHISLLLVFLPPNLASRLSGMFVSVPEEYENIKLTRTNGTDPLSWMHGHLYRVGPGILQHGTYRVSNVMDGLAKVHGWKFNGGGDVQYTAKMVKTKIYNRTMEEGSITAFSMMGKREPEFSEWEHKKLIFGLIWYEEHTDNTNIAVWDLDMGQSVTLTTESFDMHQMVPDTLNYQRPYKLPGSDSSSFLNIWGMMSLFSAAHFSKHPDDGTSFNYVAKMKRNPLSQDASYVFFQYFPSATGTTTKRLVGSIKTRKDDLRIIHQFATTKNFLVVPRWNYKVDIDTSLFSLFESLSKMACMCDVFTFEYNKTAYVDIMNIKTGDIVHFELPIQKAVHGINAFERTNSDGHLEIVMDFPCATDVRALDLKKHCLFDLYDLTILENPDYLYQEIHWDTTLRRFVFNMDTNQYRIEDLPQSWHPKDSLIEFPFINKEYNGKPYCYAYFQQWHFKTEDMDLMKYDMCTKQAITWHEANKHVLEPVFVPHPQKRGEDDGVIVAQVYDSKSGESELCVWDAKDLRLLARYDNQVRVPYTVHGDWFD